MSEIAFPVLSKAEQIAKDLSWTPAVAAAETALFTAVPWLRVWPLGAIITYAIPQFTDFVFNNLRLFLDVTAIKFVSAKHEAAWDKASIDLMLVLHDKGADSDEYKDAREKAKQALAAFASYGAA